MSHTAQNLFTGIILAAGLLASPAYAVDLEGWCMPADECTMRQMPIKGGVWTRCDDKCVLGQAVEVRDMNATLYDVFCPGDAGDHSFRALFAHVEDHDGNKSMIMLTREGVETLEECGA